MDLKKLQKGCIAMLLVYSLLAVVFWGIAGNQLSFRDEETDAVTPSRPIGELVQGMEIRQPFTARADELCSVSMLLSTYERENSSHILVGIADEAGTILAQTELSGIDIADNMVHQIGFAPPVSLTPGKQYALVLTSPDGTPGNAITAWLGDSMPASRVEVSLMIPEEDRLLVDGIAQEGMLQYRFHVRDHFLIGKYYWHLAALLGIFLVGSSLHLISAAKAGKNTLALRIIAAFQRYGYLMRQLIARDFKTKYKRSVLGVLWSFLNPLLTMFVQYIVFSTLFKSDIPNFLVYLLSGIVCFNFFSEATGMALGSIVGNAALITKVYVPKYIYPVTRVFSSTINLLLSLIPLLAVLLITQTPIRPAVLLLPFGLICLVAFCIGVGFILSTAMVFFRDTQFLWGVISMLWMYMTPVFYPESIIPAKFMPLYKCNPLYHIIRFIRIILIDGISPEPKAYALCLLVSFLPLLIGAVVFKKHQDQFILNL